MSSSYLVIFIFLTTITFFFCLRRFLNRKRTSPILVNIKKKEKYDLYIGRKNKWLSLENSKWSNPFRMKNESEREEVLVKYKMYVLSSNSLLNSLWELEGKTLGCYCYSSEKGIGKKCHGSVLIELFNDKFNK